MGAISEMEIQGSLIEPINVDVEETLCTNHKRNLILYVPGEYIAFTDAQNACHKLRNGIMGRDLLH